MRGSVKIEYIPTGTRVTIEKGNKILSTHIKGTPSESQIISAITQLSNSIEKGDRNGDTIFT